MDRKWLENLSKEQLVELCLKKDESEQRCKSDLRWIHQMMSNATATGDQKQVAYWERFHTKNGEAREDGLFHIRNLDVAKDCGLDVDKVGKVLKSFKERGLVKVKPETKRDETGQIKTKTWIALDRSLLDNPRAIDFGKNEKWGGKREPGEPKPNACGCGCSDRIVTRRVVCAGCGTILDETEKRLGENDLDLDPDEEVF